MRKQLLLLFVLVALPITLWAENVEAEPYAVLSSDKLTVTFYYDENKLSREGIDIDYFYGRPGRKPAIDKDIETRGLDQMLGEEVRKLLKSTNMDEYVFGLECLAAQLSDGGHTHISPISNSYVIGLADRSNLIEYVNKYVNAFKGQYPEEAELASSNIMADDGNEFCPHPVSASSTMQARTSTEV